MATDRTIPRLDYKSILYVTDLSEAGRVAFPHAASIANAYQAKLTVFHALDTHDFEETIVGYISEDMWDEIKHRDLDDAKQILVQRKRDNAAIVDSVDRFCRDCISEESNNPSYVSYDIQVKAGDAVETILEEANNGSYDLMVIAKRGHGVLYGGLMGDTVRRVLRRSAIPVLVVQVPENQDQNNSSP
ncbi:MAG: universal stress protein [Gammaproteobacteria bacterium]|nr:MAG: universal stress protein [Gammaproteobacteria bacterium]